jgi:hypothetical protein
MHRLHRRSPASLPRPADEGRQALIERCRAELVWARAEWLETAGAAQPYERSPASPAWQAACLPHEAAALRLLNLWGHLQPMEDRLHAAVRRLRAQRRAGWAERAAGTLEDLQWYRRERAPLWRAFLVAAECYRAERAKVGSTVSASGWLVQKARTAAKRWRKAS